MKVSLRTFALAAVFTGASLWFAPNAAGQRVEKPISEWPKPVEFPNEDRAAATEHFRKAREYAVGDLFADFTLRCITDPKYRPRVNAEQYDGIVAPAKVFDNFYYVGQMAVGSWALKTSGGIVLFDALNNEAEAREIVVPALTAVGLDPKDVKWVVITHSHGDHYGGAPYFQKLGAKMISSDLDWKAMEAPPRRPNAAPAPARDITIADDGQKMTFGDTEVTFYVTPGHTAGTLSTIIPVTDRGEKHLVGFYGGVGLPRTVETKRTQIASLVKWRAVTKAAGVDAQIGNHPLNDESLERMEQLLYRRPQDPNPYVLGVDMYQNYLGVQEECVRFSLARDGLRE
jgi:metallo-beta-lactamase class B